VRCELGAERMVLRMSRNSAEAAAAVGLSDGQLLYGEPLAAPAVLFNENHLTFEAEVLHGQKTGFFLDQRDNRARVEALAKGARVLNAFSFSVRLLTTLVVSYTPAPSVRSRSAPYVRCNARYGCVSTSTGRLLALRGTWRGGGGNVAGPVQARAGVRRAQLRAKRA
jgi:hypothetical protein